MPFPGESIRPVFLSHSAGASALLLPRARPGRPASSSSRATLYLNVNLEAPSSFFQARTPSVFRIQRARRDPLPAGRARRRRWAARQPLSFRTSGVNFPYFRAERPPGKGRTSQPERRQDLRPDADAVLRRKPGKPPEMNGVDRRAAGDTR